MSTSQNHHYAQHSLDPTLAVPADRPRTEWTTEIDLLSGLWLIGRAMWRSLHCVLIGHQSPGQSVQHLPTAGNFMNKIKPNRRTNNGLLWPRLLSQDSSIAKGNRSQLALPSCLQTCLEEVTLADHLSVSFQGELLSPCRCDGSVKCTHQPCLIKWISERGCWSCELCYYKYHVIAISTKNPLQVKVLETFPSFLFCCCCAEGRMEGLFTKWRRAGSTPQQSLLAVPWDLQHPFFSV